ncbi:MAG: hypothetical protein ACRD6X_12605 [Pyrinomonadaceae bacterium]
MSKGGIESRRAEELLESGAFADLDEAIIETANYIDGYHNPIRRHSGNHTSTASSRPNGVPPSYQPTIFWPPPAASSHSPLSVKSPNSGAIPPPISAAPLSNSSPCHSSSSPAAKKPNPTQ